MITGNTIKEQLFSSRWWGSWALVVAGAFVMAAGFVLFINPYHIVPGGVYGAGNVLHYIFPKVQVGTFGLMFDVPLLLIGLKVFGRMFGARTIVAALLTPVFMNTLTLLVGEDPATMLGGHIDLAEDMLLACIFGGVLLGAGIGLVVKTRATTGGTDIVAMLMNRFMGMKFSRALLIVDSCVVVFGIVVMGDWLMPLYSLVTIFVSTQVIDFVVDGGNKDKLLLIISDKNALLESFIIGEMERGATLIHSAGMYTKKERDMIFLVVSLREVTTVQNKIREIDRDAFVVVVNAHDTFGDGFKAFPEKI
jgi:uncharacterized membrane-anchored protein YitT (DUF2179 family)